MIPFLQDDEREIIYYLPAKSGQNEKKVAFFDLDHTLIKPKSGRKFPKDEDDYVLLFPNVMERLNEYISKDYMICIVSNQNGLCKPKNLQKKNQMITKLNALFGSFLGSICIFLACGENYYRKPHSGIFHFYESYYDLKINKKQSFFCGDALGRSGDFSDSDYYFASNFGIPVYTPEEIFEKSGEKTYHYENKAIQKVQTILTSQETKTRFDTLIKRMKEEKDSGKELLIVLCGSPASGKSTLSKYLCSKSQLQIQCCESDELKSKLEKCVETHLKDGKSVIVDATNASKAHRKKYVDMAKKYQDKDQDKDKSIYTICIYVPYDEDMIHHLQHYRIEQSKGSVEALPEIALRVFKSKYEKPIKSEGFDAIYEYIPYFTFEKKSDEMDFYKGY